MSFAFIEKYMQNYNWRIDIKMLKMMKEIEICFCCSLAQDSYTLHVVIFLKRMIEGSRSVFCYSRLIYFFIQMPWHFPIGWKKDKRDKDYEKDIGN